MTERIKPTTKSGWCISGVHKGKDSCEEFYLKQPYSRGCACNCHETVSTGTNNVGKRDRKSASVGVPEVE